MKLSQLQAYQPEMVNNLLRLYHNASPSARALGSEWYPNARAIVRDWSTTYHQSRETVACVIAALSPQLDWARNLVIADDLLAERSPSIGGALFANVRKAVALRDGDASRTLAERMIATFPTGPKVFSFACNLAGDDTCVTVDGHAAQAAFDDVKLDIRLGWTHYRVLAEAYALAAVRVGIAPATFQAIIWHEWKQRYPAGVKRHARREF